MVRHPLPVLLFGLLCIVSRALGDDEDNVSTAWEDISNTQDSVWAHFQTPQSSSKIVRSCFEPLGIQAGEFNDGEIAASSMLKNFTSTDAWCPPKNDENQYLQVDLSRKTEVTKVATQGQIGSKDRHVKTYALLYSDDGKKWQQYSSKGKEKIFEANKDSFTVHHNKLEKPLVTRYLRINPRSWENAICLRLEVFGCDV